MRNDDLSQLFSGKLPTADQTSRINRCRAAIRSAAGVLLREVPHAPEQTLAIRRLWESFAYAQLGISLDPSVEGIETEERVSLAANLSPRLTKEERERLILALQIDPADFVSELQRRKAESENGSQESSEASIV